MTANLAEIVTATAVNGGTVTDEHVTAIKIEKRAANEIETGRGEG